MKKLIILFMVVFSMGSSFKECVFNHINSNDKVVLVKWVVAAYSKSDKLKGFVTVNQEEAQKVQYQVANLFNRLIMKDCLNEFQASIKSGNLKDIQSVFFDLGKVAGLELAKDIKVQSYLLKTFSFIDLNKMIFNMWNLK